MLKEDDYEKLKQSFVDSQRLFDKLNSVANQAEELEYDESGMYAEDEETLQRHRLKLSAKIVDGLNKALDGYMIEPIDLLNIDSRELNINLVKENIVSRIKVDYSEDGAISITQIS